MKNVKTEKMKPDNRLAAIVAAALILLCHGLQARAQDINRIAADIASASRAVKTQTAGALAEAEQLRGATALANPEVEVEQLFGPRDAGDKLTVAVSQEFEFPTVYSARRRVADKAMEAAQAAATTAWLDKALEAKLTMIDIIYCRRQIEILSAMLANLQTLADKSRLALEGGEISLLEYRRFGLDRVAMQGRLSTLRLEVDALVSTLRTMAAGSDCTAAVDALAAFPDEPLMTLEEYRDQSRLLDPSAAYADASAAEAALKIKAFDAGRLPSFTLGYIFNREGGASYNGFRIGLSLPLWSAAHSRRALQLERQEWDDESRLAAIEATVAVEALYNRVQTLDAEIADLAPYFTSPSYPALLLKAYEGGQTTATEYLTEANYFIEAELQYLAKQRERAAAAARLNKFSLLSPGR